MNKRDLFILIAVIIMVSVMFIVYMLASFFDSGGAPPPSGTPSPSSSSHLIRSFEISPNPSPTPLPPLTKGLSKDNLVDLLPLQTETFDVEYLSVSDHFVITIKKDPYQTNKAAAENWLKESGLNINNLNIYWQAFPEVKK